MTVYGFKELPDLVRLRLPAIVLEVHGHSDSGVDVEGVTPALPVKLEAEGLRDFAQLGEADAGRVPPGFLDELSPPHLTMISPEISIVKTQEGEPATRP